VRTLIWQLHLGLIGGLIVYRFDSGFERIDGPFPPELVQFEMKDRTPIHGLLDLLRPRRWTLFAVGDDCLPTTVAAFIQSARHLMATSRPLADLRVRSQLSA